MGCVNTSSKEFKDLASRHNLDSATLEVLVHKYWLETGNETLFPTDVYVQAQMGNVQYEESGKNVRKLWKRDYSHPLEFSSMKTLSPALKRAERFFPKYAINYYKNAKGNFVLSIKKPVAKVSHNKDAFFKEYDNAGSTKNIKTIDLDITEGKTYGIDKVQQIFNKFNTDRTSKELASKVFNIAKDLGLQITFDESLPSGTLGRYTNNNTIRLKKSFLERDIMNDKKGAIMLHEVIHAVSMYALSDQIKSQEKSKALNKFKEEVTSLYEELKNHSALKGERGTKDIYEFVAELANPIFREKIQSIDRDNNATNKIEKKSFWSRLVNAFKQLLGIHVTSDYYQRSMNALDKALNAFDIDTYMRYNGIKNDLRKGYNAKEWEFNSMSDKKLKTKVSNYFDSQVYDEELLSLKKKAIENGTFMKAPNGEPTKLNERQWLQVRTKAFKEWFGDWESNPQNASKVVDENGEPLVVYHGGAKGIKVFHPGSSERSTTGYGTYKDLKAGKTIPVDSARTIFFSTNPFVAKSYQTLYAMNVLSKLEGDINSLLETSGKTDKISISGDRFKTWDNYFNTLEVLSEFNPRFTKLSNWLKEIKAKGQHPTAREVEAYRQMLVDARKSLEPLTERWLMHRSEWENVQTSFKNILDRYDNPEGIRKLKQGEIPSELLKEFSIYKKIERQREKEGKNKIDNYKDVNISSGTGSLSDPYYAFTYDGKTLEVRLDDATNSSVDIKSLSEQQIAELFKKYRLANENSFKLINEDESYNTLLKRGEVYPVFLNIRKPFEHDYEGTMQGQGYKQSNKYPFGYVAARQVDKAIREGSDGVVYKNLYDPYLADNYGVFHPNQIKSATNNNGEFSTTNNEIYNYEIDNSNVNDILSDNEKADILEFIDNMSGQQLRDELSTIKQESADYDLVNGIEEEHKHSGKAIPQDFTFGDGTKIKAPFRPNEQQIVALNEMDRFLKSDETSMTLSGYAGTGKTSLMEMIAKKAVKDGNAVQFCASTNKAAKVLGDKVSKADFDAKTLHKVFGIKIETNPESKKYDAKDVVNIIKPPKVTPNTTVIIDEASMINKENYDLLNEVAKAYNLKLIYVGDEAQLAPVGETEVSKVFSNGDGKVIRLTQVERTDDNAILKEATDIRNGKPLSGVTSFNSKGEGVAYIKPNHQNAIDEVLNQYVKGLKKNPDYFRVLAYYNATVSEYNTKVRSLLGFDSPTPRVGEPMTGYTNWGYMWWDQSYRLVNSEAYKVSKVEKPMTTTFVVDDGTEHGTPISLEYTPITLKDSLGNEDTFDYIDIKNNEQNRKAATLLAEKKQELWDKANRLSKSAAKPLYQEINRIEQFLFVNDDIKSSDGERTLQSKVIDFGYAMTVHKSQGSTFTHVLMDDVDIARGAKEESKGEMTFTDINLDDTLQEASDENVVSMGEEIDLGDDTTTPQATTPTTTNPNHVDKRQQLEYVAVSRATDTVTIISDNVKKEGSPLHPEEAIKEDSANKNTQQSEDTNSTKSIVNQLVEHLKSITKVFGREDMAEFLKTHNPKSLQQFINKHTLPKGELSILSSALMTKYGNNNAYGDVIQTANYEYTVNYKGAGEFDIIEFHQIDNNLSKEIDDTEREGISEAYDSLSTKDEVTKGQYPSDSYHVENREANGDNARLDKQTSQGESKQTSSDASSQQHQEWRAIKRDSATGRITFVDGDGRTITSPEDLKDAQLFTTPQGEVYGFVDKEGNIYLDETKISPEHPIHEYTHLWDRTVQKKNPKLWQKGVELMKKTSLWNEILNDANYGKLWQSMNLPQEKIDNLIASEVHARFTGKGAEQLLEKLAKEKGQEGIIDKLKQWILDVWKDLKATFSNWSQEDLDKLTLKDFNHMTVRDFADGTNLKEAEVPTTTDNVDISLPNYEKEVGTFDSLSVPKWKASYLKELDYQLNDDKTDEERKAILSQMNKVLDATSEEEYKEQLEQERVKDTDKILNTYKILNEQIDNLLDGKAADDWEIKFTNTEIRQIAALLMDDLSNLITDLQERGDSLVKLLFPWLKTSKDFSTLTRREVVDTIGLENLIDCIKAMFSDQYTDYYEGDPSIKSDIVCENWEAMMFLASDYLALNEGFGMSLDYKKGIYVAEKREVNLDALRDIDSSSTSEDSDAKEEEGRDDPEGYQIDMKTVDVLNSMSELVRQGLRQCYKLDKNNNKIESKYSGNKFKRYEKISVRDSTNSILHWCQGTKTLSEMVERLKQKQEYNPWVSQLIERLSDTSGKDTEFQSQFYGVFSKALQNYCIVKNDKGKWVSMNVNNHMVTSNAFSSIAAQFKVGEHPLFTSAGKINTKLLGTKEAVGPNDPMTLWKAKADLEIIKERIRRSYDPNLTKEEKQKAIDIVIDVYRILGFPVTRDLVAEATNAENINEWWRNLYFITKSLNSANTMINAGKLKYQPFTYRAEYTIDTAVKNFLTPVTDILEDTATQSFYNNGKMYQNYVAPSFLTKLTENMNLKGQAFDDFIMKEYGSSEWFNDKDNAQWVYDREVPKWRCKLLEMLSGSYQGMFDHKIELDFDGHGYMKKMTPQEYKVSLIAEYISDNANMLDDMAPAWFRVPMQSNKPSSDFIRLPSFREGFRPYKDTITEHLYDIALQEIMRIQTVNKRNLSKGDPEFIANFDSNGRRFCFLPVLNAYLENSDIAKEQRNILPTKEDNAHFAEILQKKVKGEEALTSTERELFEKLAKDVIKQSVENKVQQMLESWEKEGTIEALRTKLKGVFPKEFNNEGKYKDTQYKYAKKWVENYMWNDTLASKWILELTITDLAFYKNADDLQKRLSELHSSGTRANVEATDHKGNLVSDGKYRTIVLKDHDKFISNIIDNIAIVFDQKIEKAETPEAKKALEVLKDSLVRPRTYNADGTIKDKGGAYYNINVADAQGFSGLSSYRKKALMFGKWDKAAEKIYEKIKTGDYDYSDLQKAFQPLKPFVYTKVQKNIAVEGSPISTMPVPFQAKNSEYLLLMADGLLHNADTSRPNLLRAISRVMEDSEKINPTKGIDTIQFESAIKSGLQGAIDINKYLEMEGGEEGAYTAMMESIYKESYDNDGKRVYKDYNVDTFVHEMSYEGYMIQQEIPAHFKNHYQVEGSQIRAITAADLDYYTFDAKGNQIDNVYTFNDFDENGKKVKKSLKANEFRKELERTIAEGIQESIDTLAAELHLNIEGENPAEIKRNRNLALSKILQAEIASSPRYGVELLQACAIDDKTGEFRIPLGDPIQAKRIEQLINSIIKNRVNKQKIKGGPLVQVTNYGASKQLNIRFNDKNGNLMPTEAEYKPEEHENLSYEEYRKKNQGGIAYFEAMIPIWDNEIFEKFSNIDGTINIKAIEALDPDLLKMLCYRIPTEDKYSCTPIKIVGFLPKEAGDCIMLPYDLTTIDGSDYDIDKRYLMMKDIDILPNRTRDIQDQLIKATMKSYEKKNNINKEALTEKISQLSKQPKSKERDEALTEAREALEKWHGYQKRAEEEVDSFLSDPLRKRDINTYYSSLWKAYQSIAYRTKHPRSGKGYRDNKIVEMTYAALTNERSADKILNPGNFDNVKEIAYKISAYKKKASEGKKWEDFSGMSIDNLKEMSSTDRDLTFIDTQIDFYKQNAAAASLIGIFAVSKVAQALLQNDGIYINIDKICNHQLFSIGGHYETNDKGEKVLVDAIEFKDIMPIDVATDRYGNLVGKVLGSLVGAAADAVKDPVLNLLNINPTTANIFITMLRLGVDLNTAALFLSQDVIGRVLDDQSSKSLTKFTSLSDAIDEWMSKYTEKNGITANDKINSDPLLEEELIEGLTSKEHTEIDYKVLNTFKKLWSIAEEMRKPTLATRFNSISNAVGPLVIDNIMTQAKINDFKDTSDKSGTFCDGNGYNIDINYIFDKHPSLAAFADAYNLSSQIFSKTPIGSESFGELLNTFPEDVRRNVLRDRDLLNKFSNFYTSFLVMQSGLVDSSKLKEYINDFPKEFNRDYKNNEDYKDNPLIQAIQLDYQKGKAVLSVKLVGMGNQQRENLSSAWTDLHRQDPELSKKLFDYCFFRAGIGFSPKTFMSLVPVYVKERLKSEDGKVSYVDIFRKLPSINNIDKAIINQFVRNNWDEYKLAPLVKEGNFIYNWDAKTMIVNDKATMDQCKSYMKTKVGNEYHLWVKDNTTSTDKSYTYLHLDPLGNNGEYLEISRENMMDAMQKTTESLKDTEAYTEEGDNIEGSIESPKIEEMSNEPSPEMMIKMIQAYLPEDDIATVYEKYNKARESVLAGESRWAVFIQNVALKNGLELDKEAAIEWFKKFC